MLASTLHAERDVHLYLAVGDADLAALAATDQVLDTQERERASRFIRPADRELYQAAHVLLRRALSRHEPVDPAAWRFSRGAYGRPEIAAPAPPTGERLLFSLAHTRGLVCCAVTDATAVGIDAECERPLSDALDLARRFFAPVEAAALAALSPAERTAGFYAFWTLKESFVKALGVGLTMDLDRFAFRLAPGRPGTIDLTLAPPLADSDWRFVLLRIDREHTVAASVRAQAGARFCVHPIAPAGRLPRSVLTARSAGVCFEDPSCSCGKPDSDG